MGVLVREEDFIVRREWTSTDIKVGLEIKAHKSWSWLTGPVRILLVNTSKVC